MTHMKNCLFALLLTEDLFAACYHVTLHYVMLCYAMESTAIKCD
jgi:hypothetical protein